MGGNQDKARGGVIEIYDDDCSFLQKLTHETGKGLLFAQIIKCVGGTVDPRWEMGRVSRKIDKKEQQAAEARRSE